MKDNSNNGGEKRSRTMADGVETTTAKKFLTMKILVDNKSNKVLYGEAGKEVVDFLVNLLTLPIGAVVKLLEASDNGMVGCAANLYNSVQNIDASYLHDDKSKNNLLFQLTSIQSPANSASSHLLLPHKSSTTPKQYYRCRGKDGHYTMDGRRCLCKYVSDAASAKCPECLQWMVEPLTFIKGDADENKWNGGGIVKGVATYMVMDDLSITPLSMIAGIGILNKFKIIPMDVDERTVEIDVEVGLKLLKSSLQSKTVLSDVFMAKKKTVPSDRFSVVSRACNCLEI